MASVEFAKAFRYVMRDCRVARDFGYTNCILATGGVKEEGVKNSVLQQQIASDTDRRVNVGFNIIIPCVLYIHHFFIHIFFFVKS